MTDVNALKAALKAGKATITFNKVNGDRRVLVGTLNDTLLPPPHPEKTNKTKDANLLVVFDVQSHGWRTIKVDSIITWEPGEVESTAPTIPQGQPTAVPNGWQPQTTPSA